MSSRPQVSEKPQVAAPSTLKEDGNGATPAKITPDAEPAKETEAHSKKSVYRVFACTDKDTEADALEDGSWRSVGEYEVVNNEGQRSARRQALADHTELRDRITAGKPLVLLCAPKKSLHPTKVAFEQREPKLLI